MIRNKQELEFRNDAEKLADNRKDTLPKLM